MSAHEELAPTGRSGPGRRSVIGASLAPVVVVAAAPNAVLLLVRSATAVPELAATR